MGPLRWPQGAQGPGNANFPPRCSAPTQSIWGKGWPSDWATQTQLSTGHLTWRPLMASRGHIQSSFLVSTWPLWIWIQPIHLDLTSKLGLLSSSGLSVCDCAFPRVKVTLGLHGCFPDFSGQGNGVNSPCPLAAVMRNLSSPQCMCGPGRHSHPPSASLKSINYDPCNAKSAIN
jgi:hypothetical protein